MPDTRYKMQREVIENIGVVVIILLLEEISVIERREV